MEPRTFPDRHIGPDAAEIELMLSTIGAASLEALIDETVPKDIRDETLGLPPALSERQAIARLSHLAGRNEVLRSMIGMGYHGTITPPVIQRNVLENPAWYTAYTPYQAEISQGRLEALLNFQTMVEDLTGFPIANASLLDEATAAAEGMAMARRMDKGRRSTFLIDADCHPQTIAVVETRAEPLGVRIVVGDPGSFEIGGDTFGALVQYPGSTGAVRDFSSLAARLREADALLVAAADPLALTLLASPASWGAHIAVGSTQRFGVPMGFGGPHAAYIATEERMVRSLPGRLVGVSRDAAGRIAYRLALQTREQHIRRERATSNVCTAQVLLAVIAGLYASWHGPDGLTAIARRVYDHAAEIAAGLRAVPWRLSHDTWFDTVTVVTGDRTDEIMEAALRRGVNLRRVDDDRVGITCDETTEAADVDDVLAAFGAGRPSTPAAEGLPPDLLRTDEFLTHPVFRRYRSETEMLRYLRMLADKDLGLDRTMIPLGSCTMKLNATTEMVPITWPEFASIHPFVPADQVRGYHRLIEDLEEWLAEITGYDAVSLQPNAGSQGEFAGLVAIRAYHRANGHLRDVCLIPSSAHGTNAASAVMAGFRVVVVACDDDGNVDTADLAEKLREHGESVGALMVTYPSTHGVFEEAIAEICRMVHEAGGQVYVDGANLNALVGIARPGRFGADVSHLNLHKTFTIPHGGGGPGVGPIGVRAHLAPYLPGHPVSGGPNQVGPVSAARWGSAGILPIPWAYIAMMGATGLRRASQVAILAANYLAVRLSDAYEILYRGRNGRVAHECIVDLRGITKSSGITAEDVAKRLADYGFHAPTLSFPVAGTLMIEPTESESLEELDRFVDAMLAIRVEIDRVEEGTWPRDDNPLVRAPHPASDLIGAWDRAYPADVAAFPVSSLRQKGYFPPVGRIDGPGGDRDLVCACPPIEAFAD